MLLTVHTTEPTNQPTNQSIMSTLDIIRAAAVSLRHTHSGVEVSASCSSTCCPGMRITVDVLCGTKTGFADLPWAGKSPGLTDDELAADWLAVTQSTASDMTCMLLCRTPAWTFCCIVAFNLCYQCHCQQAIEEHIHSPRRLQTVIS